MSVVGPEAVLQFWFGELTAQDWWRKDPALDARIRERFGSTLAAAARCELFGWRDSARHRLAEVIVLDQFSRTNGREVWRLQPSCCCFSACCCHRRASEPSSPIPSFRS